LHRAGPFAGDQLAQIAVLHGVVAVHRQSIHGAHGQDGADAEGHGGGIPHFDTGGVDSMGQPLATPLFRRGQSVPAGGSPGAVGLLPAGRRGHRTVLDGRAVRVADAIERRYDILCEAPGLGQHRVDRVLGEVAIEALPERLPETRSILERGSDVGNRRAVGHTIFPVIAVSPRLCSD
jgi:hypothetical protein